MGQYRCLELAGEALERVAADPLVHNTSEEQVIEGAEWQVMPPLLVAHTNHYLHPRFAEGAKGPAPAHSSERYERVLQIAEEYETQMESRPRQGAEAEAELARRILGDRVGAPRSILYDDAAGLSPEAPSGTICSIVMELRTLQMKITRGSAMSQSYVQVPLRSSSL